MKNIIISSDYAHDIETSSDEFSKPEPLTQVPVHDDEMVGLFRALQTMMPQKAGWTLGIISTLPGEGTSTIARALAGIVTRTTNAKVLICDVTNDARTRDQRAAVRTSVGDGAGRVEFNWLPGSQVAIGSFGEPGEMNSLAADVEGARSMVSTASAGFELMILDLPPVSAGVVGPALAKAVDGVILVVEAERTRMHSVRATQKTLEMFGGRVLGVVLNKRRFHIPNFIYSRL
jgi:Mrp family chromosome partitioning ATPase